MFTKIISSKSIYKRLKIIKMEKDKLFLFKTLLDSLQNKWTVDIEIFMEKYSVGTYWDMHMIWAI
jgi:hypothetical protein